MTPTDLSSELRRTAEATAESILASARSEAQRLSEEAERKLARALKASLAREEAGLRSEARVATAAARQEAMRELLLAQTKLVDRVLEEAKKGLFAASRSEAYLSRLPAELEQALRFLKQGEPALVRCPVDLLEAVKTASRGRPGVRVEADPELQTGFVLTNENGSLKVDKRLERGLEEASRDLAIAIHTRLEELGDGLLSR